MSVPRRAVVAWVLYDLANTIFSMGVVSLYFGLYVRSQVGAERADRTYGLITALSMGMSGSRKDDDATCFEIESV